MMDIRRYGLFLGDSILFDFFEHDEQLTDDLKQRFNLDFVRTAFKKGGTIDYLASSVFPRQIVEINNLERGDEILVDVFLVAGAVDISDAIPSNPSFDLERFLFHRNKSLKLILDHPFVHRLFLYPLTPREVCRNPLKARFPKYGRSDWIEYTNRCIKKVNKSNEQFHCKLRFVSSSLCGDIFNHVARDGIHLLPKGKRLLARSVLGIVEEKKLFSSDEFPPLQCKKTRSPLQAIDARLAQLEALRREAKAKAVVVDLSGPVKTKQEFCNEAGSRSFDSVSRKKVRKTKKKTKSSTAVQRTERNRHFQKVEHLYECLTVCTKEIIFSSKNIIHKGITGEERLVRKIARNIMRLRNQERPSVVTQPSINHPSSAGHFLTADRCVSTDCTWSGNSSPSVCLINNGHCPISGSFLSVDQKISVDHPQTEAVSLPNISLRVSARPLVRSEQRLPRTCKTLSNMRKSVNKTSQREQLLLRYRNILKELRLSRKSKKRLSSPQKLFRLATADVVSEIQSQKPDSPKMIDPKTYSRQKRNVKTCMKKIKQFFTPLLSDTDKGLQNEKIRLTFHTKNGMMLEHIRRDGKVDTVFDSLNLHGGGKRKRTKSQEREKKKRQREKLDEEKKQKYRDNDNER